jgi:hypothetical protein
VHYTACHTPWQVLLLAELQKQKDTPIMMLTAQPVRKSVWPNSKHHWQRNAPCHHTGCLPDAALHAESTTHALQYAAP